MGPRPDRTDHHPTGSGGNGTWDATTVEWYKSPGGTETAYPNGAFANFAGTAGTVSLNASGLTANGLAFDTAGYVLQDAAGTAYALTITASGAVQTGFSSGTATVNLPLTLSASPQLRAQTGSTLSWAARSPPPPPWPWASRPVSTAR